MRLIGVMEAEQIEGSQRTTNNRLFGVALHSYNHSDFTSISQINRNLVDQITEFFIAYNKSRGKKFKPKGIHGPKRAAKLIEEGVRAFEKKSGKGQAG